MRLDSPDIRLHWSDAKSGGCNACFADDLTDRFLHLRIGGHIVRLCEPCTAALTDRLRVVWEL